MKIKNSCYKVIVPLFCFFLLWPAFACRADIPRLDVNEKTISILTNDFFISKFLPEPSSSSYYAVAFKENSDNYSLLYIEKNQANKILTLPIPVDAIPNPYQFKDGVRVFQLVDNRYLYIGVRHLEGDIFVAIVDTQDSSKVINSFTIESSGFSDIFVGDGGVLRIIGTNESLFVITVDKGQETFSDRKYFGAEYPKTVENAALLSGGKMIVTSTYVVNDSVKSEIYLLDEQGEMQRRAEVDGVVFNILSSSENTALVLVVLDQEGEDTEAIVFSADLTREATFALPPLGRLITPVNQMSVTSDSRLVLTEVGSEKGNYIDVVLMGAEKPPQVQHFYEKSHEKEQVLYDTILLSQGEKTYIGLTEMLEKESHLEKRFSIFEIELNR